MRIDVFDFDGTIYDGDSTVDFLRYAVRRRPSLIFSLLSGVFRAGGYALTGRISLTVFKSCLFSALARHLDLSAEAERFWADEKTQAHLGEWFLRRERTLPVVIASASPDFELRPAARLLSADLLVSTPCDAKTGRLTAGNCKSAEKIRRIRQELGDFEVRSMYTDNPKADGPLLALAEERYLVTHGAVHRLTPEEFAPAEKRKEGLA